MVNVSSANAGVLRSRRDVEADPIAPRRDGDCDCDEGRRADQVDLVGRGHGAARRVVHTARVQGEERYPDFGPAERSDVPQSALEEARNHGRTGQGLLTVRDPEPE